MCASVSAVALRGSRKDRNRNGKEYVLPSLVLKPAHRGGLNQSESCFAFTATVGYTVSAIKLHIYRSRYVQLLFGFRFSAFAVNGIERNQDL